MAHTIYAVFTNHEVKDFPIKICHFCGKQVYPSQQADKTHESGYIAEVHGMTVLMHGCCDPDKEN